MQHRKIKSRRKSARARSRGFGAGGPDFCRRFSFVIGVDEAGRGALAGAVFAAAALLPRNFRTKNSGIPLRDSKKLTAGQRERWFSFLKKRKILWAAASVRPRTIDRINVSRAANLAAGRAFKKLDKRLKTKNGNFLVCLDGGLYLPENPNRRFSVLNSIVKGDEKIAAVALASIVAKVMRDRAMARLAREHPRYGFGVHKGYGTEFHYRMLKKFGSSAAHRKSFRIC